ncbi:unnamed protein product [Ambrosiozyma monospora]|uniref:Unnamed protein product n=1 Tax=Ambrosiozyma monospora TaxID=43982 RepID=A0ACB5T8E6_AMBMO|nr:unnamed protein product [Ambrosiozyma monospora]
MELEDCSCFQYEPEQAFLNDLPACLWCNMYFIYNKKKKRVAFLNFRATRLLKNDDVDLVEMGSDNTHYNGYHRARVGSRNRRNSKVGTLDEDVAGFDETQEEYDLRYAAHNDPNAEVIYEDVFDDDDDDDDIAEDYEDEAIDEDTDDVMENAVDDEDYEYTDGLSIVNQDDEDEYGAPPEPAVAGEMELD